MQQTAKEFSARSTFGRSAFGGYRPTAEGFLLKKKLRKAKGGGVRPVRPPGSGPVHGQVIIMVRCEK